jgi:hypothetical protein
VALLGAGLLVYSQTAAFAWDEGFHLLAAQSIASGRTPYLDFIFAQTPLNAYWNGAWIRLFGFSWRGIHAVTALLTLAAVVLAADFLRTRFRIPGWQNAAMITALLLSGSNLMIVEFGTIGQAYGLALFLTVAAFRAAVLAEESGRAGWSALAGLLSAAAAGSTLLTAPVAPVLLLWIVYYTWARGWMKHVVLFAAGAIAALSPILILLARSPGQVVFDIFKYHIFYRRSGWEGATQHDLSVLTGWIDFPQAIILGIFAAAGLWFVMRRSGWDRARRAEFYLCGWISLGIAVHVSTAHPTFERYYLFTVPFLSILCAAGIYAFAAQMGAEKAFWPVAGVLALALLGLGKALYEARDDTSWDDLQKVAMEVQRVTPPGAMLYADEHVYFLDRLRPPPGNEYLSSHLLDLPAPLSATQHIVPQAEWDREIAAGKFSTVETCEAEDWIEERKLTLLYKQKTEVSGCNVFWDRAGASVNSPGR